MTISRGLQGLLSRQGIIDPEGDPGLGTAVGVCQSGFSIMITDPSHHPTVHRLRKRKASLQHLFTVIGAVQILDRQGDYLHLSQPEWGKVRSSQDPPQVTRIFTDLAVRPRDDRGYQACPA